ncbi:hypothetical protein [Janthinobacterium sp. BJB446]|uniref:hypothetical protein n=1 Tax=Janthinobacterium sp. BJB446 TaxID=2048009 RepID=UPI00117BD587|nr:hypothetical protein [Janthinobacterium sp. BJB446]
MSSQLLDRTPGASEDTQAPNTIHRFFIFKNYGLEESKRLVAIHYMAFSDSRPTFKKLQTEAEAEEATNASPANDNPRSKTWKFLAEQDTDNALAISWIRWVPDSPIPLQRYISKYGKPEKTGFGDSDMRPYASWPKKNIHANLSDDEKFVNNVEFGFTKQEKIAACHERTAKKFWPTSCNYSD